jgi:cyclopropane fatty-acyl-phospholipid synthase-like methyltransferase
LKDGNLAVADFSKQNPFEIVDFDVVYSITVIEYIPFFNIKKFLRNVSLALRNNGVLYLQFPHGNSLLDLIKNLDYTRYPAWYIERLLEKQGFKINESKALVPDQEFEFGHYIICSKKD